ncbi:MAG: sulfite exporter TauE/SafE family protein [Desulfurococcales archaeon]|nr:sulfite exporter TauE/SafE family protein [Desulfurococcales archaeon]
MTTLFDAVIFLSFGFLGGFLGSVLGVGGGSLMTPLLLLAGYDILTAVPASLLAIVGTSIGGLYVYEERNLINYEFAIYAEAVTIPGSITGVMIATAGFERIMRLTLAAVLVVISMSMARTAVLKQAAASSSRAKRRPVIGFTAMYAAGLVSALAGIGGGILKVPVLNRLLGIDVKEAVATSKLMVGITGAASALGYYASGYMNSCLALSLLAGSLVGGLAGSSTGVRLSGRAITVAFSIFLAVMAVVVVVRG